MSTTGQGVWEAKVAEYISFFRTQDGQVLPETAHGKGFKIPHVPRTDFTAVSEVALVHEDDGSKYEGSSILSLFDKDKEDVLLPGGVVSDLHISTQLPDLQDPRVSLTACGCVTLPQKVIRELSSEQTLSVFNQDDSKYGIEDIAQKIIDSPNTSRFATYLDLQKCEFAETDLEAADIVSKAAETIHENHFLQNPEEHRKALLEIACQVAAKSGSVFGPFLVKTPLHLLRPFFLELPGAEESLTSAIQSLERSIEQYEQTENPTDLSKRITLSTYLMAKELIPNYHNLQRLVDTFRKTQETNFASFIVKTVNSLLLEEQQAGETASKKADCRILLHHMRADPVGDAVMHGELLALRSERTVNAAQVREHLTYRNEQSLARRLRTLRTDDQQRERFQQRLREKSYSVRSYLAQWYISANSMSPYSCTFISPRLRLPSRWETLLYAPLMQHAVLRCYETWQYNTDAIQQDRSKSTFATKGQFKVRTCGTQSSIALAEIPLDDTEEIVDGSHCQSGRPVESDIWTIRAHASTTRFGDTDLSEVLSDLGDVEGQLTLRPLKCKKDIRTRIKRINQMIREHRDCMREKYGGVIPHAPSSATGAGSRPSQPDKREKRSRSKRHPSSDEIVDQYYDELHRKYRASSTEEPPVYHKDEIHRHMLATHARRHPKNFHKLLKPTAVAPAAPKTERAEDVSRSVEKVTSEKYGENYAESMSDEEGVVEY